MSFRRRVPRLALAALMFAAAPATAQTLQVSYAISLIGLPLGGAAVKAEITPTHYAIDAKARLTGLASVVNNASGASIGHGTISAGKIVPTDFATTAWNATSTRTIRMALKDNAVTGVDISPPFDDKPDRVPLRPQDTHDVIDPVSAFVVPIPASGPPVSPAACERTLPIFDGYTRFDLKLTYVGQKQVSTRGYKGPVAVCNVRYVPIAGYRRDRPSTKFMAENKDVEVWLAPVAGAGVLAPYKVSVRTMVGVLALEATEFATTK